MAQGGGYQKEQTPAQAAKSQALAVRNQQTLAKQQQLAAEISKQLPAAVQSIEGLQKTFDELRGKANLITPLMAVNTMLPMHQISLRVAIIDPTVTSDGNGPECYRGSFCEENERALGKVALDKIEAAAGVVRVPELSGRTDDRSEPDYCEFQVTLRMTDFDGTVRMATGTKELDLRRGAPETLKPAYKKDSGSGWRVKSGEMEPISEANLMAKRTHKVRLCETKARLAAIRELLGIRQKYTLEELSRPFVIPMLVPFLDPNDPDVKQRLLDRALGSSTPLYGKEPAKATSAETVALPASKPVQGERIDSEPEGEEPGTAFSDEELEAQAESEPAPKRAPAPAADDSAGFGEPEPQYVCGCPCGHQLEIKAKVAEYTRSKADCDRCKLCWPWHSEYDVQAHKDLPTLQLKRYPEMTPAEAQIESVNQQQKEAAALAEREDRREDGDR